jgi:hypothetical protein
MGIARLRVGVVIAGLLTLGTASAPLIVPPARGCQTQ